MLRQFVSLLPALILVSAAPATAASSDWAQMEGGAVRLVLSAQPDAQGERRGALEIELKPGWKTYWMEPGGSGVPPSVEISADGNAVPTRIAFPAPQRHEDGGDVWAGYDHSVSFALTLAPPPGVTVLDASVFLGVCRDICIPVQTNFHIDASGDESPAADEQAVTAAFAALPQPPRGGLRVTSARVDGQSLVVEAEAPMPADAELFLASDAGPVLGTPSLEAGDARLAFRVPLLDKLAGSATRLSYTLVSGGNAVAGTVDVTR